MHIISWFSIYSMIKLFCFPSKLCSFLDWDEIFFLIIFPQQLWWWQTPALSRPGEDLWPQNSQVKNPKLWKIFLQGLCSFGILAGWNILQIQDFILEYEWVIQVLKCHQNYHRVGKYKKTTMLLIGFSLKKLVSFCHILDGHIRI